MRPAFHETGPPLAGPPFYISLAALRTEWAAVSQDLWSATQDSHRRYGAALAVHSAQPALRNSAPVLANGTPHVRIYAMVSRRLPILEDPRCNSHEVLQQLLWLTMIAWAGQLSTTSNGCIRLPPTAAEFMANWQSASATAGSSSSLLLDIPACPLLTRHHLWAEDIHVADEKGSKASAEARHLWGEIVMDTLQLWCPAATSTAASGEGTPAGAADMKCRASASPLSDAQLSLPLAKMTEGWHFVSLSQHYHRFKALLALFFVRYDALLEDAPEQQQQRWRTELLRMGGSGGVRVAGSSSPAAATAQLTPTTGHLLSCFVLSLINENCAAIQRFVGEVVVRRLLPRTFGTMCLGSLALSSDGLEKYDKNGGGKEGRGGARAAAPHRSKPLASGSDEEESGEDTIEWSVPPSPLLKTCETTEDSGGVGSCSNAAPNLALAITAFSTRQRGRYLEEQAIRHVSKLLQMLEDCKAVSLHQWLKEGGKQATALYGVHLSHEYFCSIGNPTVPSMESSFSGASSTATQQHSSTAHVTNDGVGVGGKDYISTSSTGDTSLPPRGKQHTLAEANQILREVLQAYIRLRSKLLFFNAGTTHYIDALTPWGRTRMLETLNAFLCGLGGGAVLHGGKASDSRAMPLQWPPLLLSQPSTSRGLHDQAQRYTLPFPGIDEAPLQSFFEAWSVPLWIAMCDEVHRRIEGQQCAAEKLRGSGHGTNDPAVLACPTLSTATGSSPPQHQQQQPSPQKGEEYSTASVTVTSHDFNEISSQSTSYHWPPPSPTRNGAAPRTAYGFTEGRRQAYLKKVMMQSRGPAWNPTMTSIHTTPTAAIGSGGNDVATTEPSTVLIGGGRHLFEPHSALGVTSESFYTIGSQISEHVGDGASPPATFPGRDYRCLHNEDQRGSWCLTQEAQLQQVALLPTEGFPTLLYIMPRRSRNRRQDDITTAVQQQLFNAFSNAVQQYFTKLLEDHEADAIQHSKMRRVTPLNVARPPSDARRSEAALPPQQVQQASALSTLPTPVLERIMYLLNTTYLALEGGPNGAPPLMETGMTSLGEEYGAPLLEGQLDDGNGEYDSNLNASMATPQSTAKLAIVALRKGLQRFFSAHENRCVNALAQALHVQVLMGAAQTPPTLSIPAVDTLLNMAALLDSKDIFVSVFKGYLAPHVMMVKSMEEATVESQVVARMVYRLGAAVAAPCVTLLRDLRLALTDGRGNGACLSYTTELEGLSGVTDGAQLIATRAATTLAAAPLRQCSFLLIHRVRVLCQAWWQPHTALLLSSKNIKHLYEVHGLLEDRVVDAVQRVEWIYDGHPDPFPGYGRLALSRTSRPGYLSYDSSSCASPKSSTSLTNPYTVSIANISLSTSSVVHGFSSVLSNAVRRTGGHRSGAFGNEDTDNEEEDYSAAYGGLLTLSTLRRYQGEYTRTPAPPPSYRGSGVSSIGGTDYQEGSYNSEEGHSTVAEENSTALPTGSKLERRRLRWPLGSGYLTFLVYSKAVGGHLPNSKTLQITAPPVALLVLQWLDAAPEGNPYTFDKLHETLPITISRTLLAHLLYELVQTGVVMRAFGVSTTRQYTYRLTDRMDKLPRTKVSIDLTVAIKQEWVTRTFHSSNGTELDEGKGDVANDCPGTSTDPHCAKAASEPPSAETASAVAPKPTGTRVSRAGSSPTYSLERLHKVKVYVIRFMKSDGLLQHQVLLQRVAAALEDQFVVSPSLFKRCIAHLIEREFLQRNEKDEYIYLS